MNSIAKILRISIILIYLISSWIIIPSKSFAFTCQDKHTYCVGTGQACQACPTNTHCDSTSAAIPPCIANTPGGGNPGGSCIPDGQHCGSGSTCCSPDTCSISYQGIGTCTRGSGGIHAVDCKGHNACGDDMCPAQATCIISIFPKVINAALQIIGAVVVIIIIMAGIKFLMSGGDNKQIEGAKNTLTYAIIGLVIVFGSYLIINLIAFVTGVHCIQFFGFNNCQ